MRSAMSAVLVGLFVLAAPVWAEMQPMMGMNTIGEALMGSINKANELLFMNEREAAVNELKKSALFLQEQAKNADTEGRKVFENLAHEFEGAAEDISGGGESGFDYLYGLVEYQVNVGYRIAKAEGAASVEHYEEAGAELSHVSSYLGEMASGVGENAHGKMTDPKKWLDAKQDLDHINATIGESVMGTTELTAGSIVAVGEHIKALFMPHEQES